MASTISCLFNFLLVVLKLLEIACSFLKLATTILLHRLDGRHDADPIHIPSVASVTFNELCATCLGIVDIISHPGWHKDLVHHESLESLEKSSEQFCGICVEALEYIRGQYADSLETMFPIKCESDTSSASWQSSFELTLKSSGRVDFSLRFIFETIEQPQIPHVEYRPSSSTDSPESWDLMNRWMHECTRNHDRCNAAIPERWFPSRVLDITDADQNRVRLVSRDCVPPGQPYATLSHCWGNLPLLQTRGEILDEFMSGICLSRLPKTFLDAVSITQRLGLRYLWIDSLCIVQDSSEDWTHEADLMSRVYRYCFINIAATGSENSTGGCFWDRDPRTVLPTQLIVHWSGCRTAVNKRYLIISESDVWARKLTHEPLNQRAWVLQERILSPRVLHFGRRQLFWECRHLVACETYPHGLPACVRGHTSIDIKSLQLGDETKDDRWPSKYVSIGSSGGPIFGRLWNAFMKLFRPIVIQEVTLYAAMRAASVFQDWDAVLELYTALALTYDSDKLVALAGVAGSISMTEPGVLGDGYIAGLWQSSLPAYLLWELVRGNSLRIPPTRPRFWVAPTWSWASIIGKISFASCQHNYNPNDYLTVLQTAEVVLSHGTFGQVESGHLALLGPVASVLWTADQRTQVLLGPMTAQITQIFPPDPSSHIPVSVEPDKSTDAELFFDTATNGTSHSTRSEIDSIPEVLMLLPIVGVTKRSAHENETVVGLILIPAETKWGEFERVGIFYVTRLQIRRILKDMPRQSIRIV